MWIYKVLVSRTSDVMCAVDHVVRNTWPSPVGGMVSSAKTGGRKVWERG